MRLAAGVVIAWALAGSTAWAQPPNRSESPNRPWWKDANQKAELRLSEDQATRVETIYQEWRPRLDASFRELRKRESQLDTLIRGNDTSEAEIIRQLEQVKQARGEMNQNWTLMLYRMYRVLAPDQRARLEEIRKRNERSRGPSRGGPPRDGRQ
jgi:Spy/CpxP family protein refolding chaperone